MLLLTIAGEDGGGNPQFIQSAMSLDGTPSPVYSQNNLPDRLVDGKTSPNTHVVRRSDGRRVEIDRLQDGTLNEHQTHVVSIDSQTLTVTIDGTNADGPTFRNVGVFEKR